MSPVCAIEGAIISNDDAQNASNVAEGGKARID
eukprot:CAMPEP_0117475236 /NCGR_PEP_ID=MMETSP0784-20121206/9690_1 /TAXON_ID=39447 /ORGANISM="" /LENGTH=32 /DNA_ID= /DNA_START= /DNA_END= /DNA_ORIENTATION=